MSFDSSPEPPAGLQPFGHHLEVARPELCPEVRLWLLHGRVDLNAHQADLQQGASAPYWAFCWGSGQALARYILDHPELVRGKRVVDLGCGGGVVAVAAARAGARGVTAVDLDPDALRAAAANAALNGVRVRVGSESPADADVVLAADVLYHVGTAAQIAAWAERATVVLGDPHRHGPPPFPLEPLAEYTARTQPDVDYPLARAWVYVCLPGAVQGVGVLGGS